MFVAIISIIISVDIINVNTSVDITIIVIIINSSDEYIRQWTGSDNGLSPVRCQAVIWTNEDKLSTRPTGIECGDISIAIQIFSFRKMRLKMSSAK